MFIFPMTKTSYWLIGLAIILICGFIGLFVSKFKTHNSFKGFVSGLQYGFIFWMLLYMLVFPYLKQKENFMTFYLISQLTTFQTNMPGLCLPSNQTANLAVYTNLKTAYEQGLHYFNQIKLEDNTITYNLNDVKKALVNDVRATIGQETLTDHVPSDPKFKTSQTTQITIQKFQKDIFLQ